MPIETPSAVARAAAQELMRQHDSGETFAPLKDAWAPRSAGEAYAIQDAYVAGLMQRRGTVPAGYKIALTTPAMRAFVGYQDSMSGRLLADQIFPSGQVVTGSDYGRLIVEFEIAFRLARDLPAQDAAWTREALAEYVMCGHPALEVADDRNADYTQLASGILTLAADNSWNQGLVLGDPVVGCDAAFLLEVEGVASIDGEEVGRGTGADVLGHPLDALAWLAAHLQQRGHALRAGDLVTTGSLVRSQFPKAGSHVAFELAGFGSVELTVR